MSELTALTDDEKRQVYRRLVDALIRECQEQYTMEPLDAYWADRLTGLQDARQRWIEVVGEW